MTVTLSSANKVFLMIDATEENVAADAREENSSCLGVGPNNGIPGQVLRLKGVDPRKPYDGSPS